MRNSPISPPSSRSRQRPSFLLLPSELASQTTLSPQEASKRLQNLALFNSVDNLPGDVSDVLATPRFKGLSASDQQLLRETHEVRKGDDVIV